MDIEEQETWECGDCGEVISADDTYPGEDGTDLCESCYNESTFDCCACFEDDYESVQHNMIVLADPRAAGVEELKPGIYRVVRKPYYVSYYLGGHLYASRLEYMGGLLKGTETEGLPCGHLCEACQHKAERNEKRRLRRAGGVSRDH